MTAPDHNRFTAAACATCAAEWRVNGSSAQQAFAPVLESWAADAVRRHEQRSEQLQLFEEQAL